MTSLQGQSALITGGGSGIGLACATHLAHDGATVVLAGRTADKLAIAAAGLRAAGADVHTVVCDVTDEAQVQAACDQAAAFGRFTMVVANAGSGSAAPLHLTTLDDWNSVLASQPHRCVPHHQALGGAPGAQRRRRDGGHLLHRRAAHAPVHDPVLRQQGRAGNAGPAGGG